MRTTALIGVLLLFVLAFFAVSAFGRASYGGGAGDAGYDSAAAAPFDAVAATEVYMARISPEARAKSDAYFEGGYWLTLWNFLLSSAVMLVLLTTGLSARMQRIAEKSVKWRWLQPLLYGAMFLIVTTLATLPLTLYEGYFREHTYGMSNQTLGGYLGDQAMNLVVSAIFGGFAILVLYAILRRVKRAWWVWASGAAVAMIFVLVALGPVFIAPLFNTYHTMDDAKLRDPILSLARANMIPADQVYVFDASKQTKRVSANVSGIFGTMRISLNDNLINRSSPESVKAVMGHEMGHFVLNHIYKFVLQFALVITAGFAFCAWAFERVVAKRGAAWGIGSVADPAGLPLISLLIGAFMFVATPVTNSIIRTQEVEADQFGLNAAREPDGFAEAALMLSEYRKMKPGKWEEIVFYDHPSGYNRISMAMRWKAENPAPSAAGR